jgi:hypothetical protein
MASVWRVLSRSGSIRLVDRRAVIRTIAGDHDSGGASTALATQPIEPLKPLLTGFEAQ